MTGDKEGDMNMREKPIVGGLVGGQEVPEEMQGGTMREKVVWLLEDKDAHFTANWLIADQILALLRSEIEKAELTKEERDAVYDTLPDSAACGDERKAFCQAQLQKILDLLQGEKV